MMQLVFMVEEPSAANLLELLLPKILPADVDFLVIRHRGKSELRKSIPVKLKAWRVPDTRFIVMHDQDSRDCVELKRELHEICRAAGRPETLVRIVCQELESWYFGDPDAVGAVFGKLAAGRFRGKAPYRIPDRITKPSIELERLIPSFQKGYASENVPRHMDPDANSSTSFRHLVTGVRRLCQPAV